MCKWTNHLFPHLCGSNDRATRVWKHKSIAAKGENEILPSDRPTAHICNVPFMSFNANKAAFLTTLRTDATTAHRKYQSDRSMMVGHTVAS